MRSVDVCKSCQHCRKETQDEYEVQGIRKEEIEPCVSYRCLLENLPFRDAKLYASCLYLPWKCPMKMEQQIMTQGK